MAHFGYPAPIRLPMAKETANMDQEVDQERNGDAHHVAWDGDDLLALEREHDDDGEKQRNQRDWPDLRHEAAVIPVLGDEAQHDDARQNSRRAGDAQVDEDAFRDLPDGYVDHRTGQPEQRRQHRDENPGVDAVEQNLEDRIESHEPGRVFRRSLGNLVPHDHHGNATGQPDQDKPAIYSGLSGRKTFASANIKTRQTTSSGRARGPKPSYPEKRPAGPHSALSRTVDTSSR